jgi:hypothetical protein
MRVSRAIVSIYLCLLSVAAMPQTNSKQKTIQKDNPSQTSLLKAAEVTTIIPSVVFFHGQSAPVQTRNSGGVRFEDKSLMLVALVDTSGYSSQVQEKYQAYLITESPLNIDGHQLAPGVYGCGFLNDSGFVVMDIGGHDLFSAHVTHDGDMHRPTPLQVIAAPNETGSYRIYAGRTFVTFRLATEK